MLAILYIAGMIYFGNCVCRCFYRFNSVRHRFAASFLVGLLLSSIISYLGSLAFAWSEQPLVMGNIIFLGAIILAAVKLPRHRRSSYLQSRRPRPPGNPVWDWICLGYCFIFGCWLMFATLSFQDGNFQFGFKSWSDFGANLSVSQSLVLGRNFPTEHPFFPGEIIRYHFLFWFQAANLSFLGFNLIWSVNLLSILSLTALLILIMTFAESLFESRAVGRIAAFLFFFASSSLSYIPFLRSQTSLGGAVSSILGRTDFLASGYDFRGETWGALSVDIFVNQRHLISGVGLLFVVMIFLVDFCRHKMSLSHPDIDSTETIEIPTESNKWWVPILYPNDFRGDIPPLLFSGFVLGALPYWNSAVFVAALILLGSLLLFLPFRRYLIFMIGTAVLVGLPQVLILRSGNLGETSQSLFEWGYIIANPTIPLVLEYLAWTFGFKWILIFVALWFSSGFQRRLFLALSSLLFVVFLLRLSTDAFNNHKLLNVWITFTGVYVAYALWRIGRAGFGRALLAIALTLAMIFGAIVDLFPVYNDPMLVTSHKNDRLTDWVIEETKPSDIFLTNPLLSHQILFAGRKIFFGYTLFAWTAGYNLGDREIIYRQMFEERNVNRLVRLLRRHKIAYVVIDDGVRENNMFAYLNESVYQQNFERVFEDTEHRYANLTIYKVPSCDCHTKDLSEE